MQGPLVQNDVIEKWSRFLQGSLLFQGLQVRDLTEALISTEAFKVHTKIVEQRCVLLDCVIYREMSFTFNHLQLPIIYWVLEILRSYIFQNLRLQFNWAQDFSIFYNCTGNCWDFEAHEVIFFVRLAIFGWTISLSTAMKLMWNYTLYFFII